MLRSEIYESIIKSFEEKYSWLGKAFAEEFCLSAASWNIQTYSDPEFRIRRHLALYWSPAWLKTTMLMKAGLWLGGDLCIMMSDVSTAALRGTVEAGQFISPFVLKRPFGICSEFGQVIGSANEGSEIIQKLLNVLEEGVVTVSLGKISYMSVEQRKEAEDMYGITFVDRNTFTYKTNWILLAATYNQRFLVDNAFESRFNIMYPEQKLDNELTKHVTNAGRYVMDADAHSSFQSELLKDAKTDLDIKLPSWIYDQGKIITPRISGSLLSHILCRSWWGLKTSDEDIQRKIDHIFMVRDIIWKAPEEKVLESIELEAKTTDEIVEETGLTKLQVTYALKTIRAIRVLDEGKSVWRMS